MKFSRSMTLWGTVLSLSGFFGGMPSVLADDDDRTTASEVVDPETNMVDPEKLKAFVLSARDHYTSITNFSELFTLLDLLREEGGDWNYKSIYLVVLTPEGVINGHGEDESQDGTNVTDAVDDNGKEVVKEILEVAAAEEGGFVEYTWDDPSTADDVNPRVCYA